MEKNWVRKTLSAQVTDQLRKDIITRVFPVGSHLTVKSIAERYETSPIPVREAFNALSGERLVQLEPYRGAIVCPIDKHFYMNIQQILNSLEMLMAESCLENWTDELDKELTAINEQIHELQTMELIRRSYQELNGRFHRTIEQFSTNTQALELIAQYRNIIDLITREYDSVLVSVERLNKSYDEHCAILEGFRNRDWCQLMKAYAAHGRNSYESSMHKIFGE